MSSMVLERPTLVLNRNWQPVGVASVARSLVMVWNETARVVDPDDYQLYGWLDWSKLVPRDGELYVSTVYSRIRVPEVVALTRYDGMPTSAVTFSRRNIYKRDRYTCQYCGHPARQRGIDHRPRPPAVARGTFDVGELRAGLHLVQQAQGRPHARTGKDAAEEGPRPPGLETALRDPARAGR